MEPLRAIKKADLESFIIEYLVSLGYFSTRNAFSVNFNSLYVEYFVLASEIPGVSEDEIEEIFSGEINNKLSELTNGGLSKNYYSFWEFYEKTGNRYYAVRFVHNYTFIN